MTSDAIIVGGGIAGLAAAYELHRTGLSFVLLERGARAGGVILSEEIDGFTIDGGPDALLVQKPDGVRLCEELGIASRLVPTKPPRIAYIQRAGRLHPLPTGSVLGIPTRVGPFIRTGLFSWPGKVRMAAELFVPRRLDEGDESIADFIGRRFGAEAVEYLAEPLLAGIHAGDVNRLSARALFPRFVAAEREAGSLLRAFRRTSKRQPQGSQGAPAASDGVFRSLPGGLSELVMALVAALPASAVRLNTPALRITGSGLFHVATPDGVFEARAVIVAAPTYAAAELIGPLDPELAQLCAGITYSSVATVALGFERTAIAHPLNGSGFVVPRVESNEILAASWLSSKWPHRAPEDRALVRTFIGGARDPSALQSSDDELVGRSVRALTPVLGIRAAPILTRVYRFPRANAQHEVGHLARVAAIDNTLARHPGLFMTGSGLRGVGIPDCVADSRRTARAAAQFLSVNRMTKLTEETRRTL
jgi:oxygen-dependent protoporphyrinogen oxidase